MKRTAVVLLALALCTGCLTGQRGAKPLAIVERVYQDKTDRVYLPNDYGFLIQWVDHQDPEFYLYDKTVHHIQMRSDFSEFLAGLEQFPNNVKLDRIRGCAITEQGMPVAYKERLARVIKEKGFCLTGDEDGNFGVCTCETIRVRWFKAAQE